MSHVQFVPNLTLIWIEDFSFYSFGNFSSNLMFDLAFMHQNLFLLFLRVKINPRFHRPPLSNLFLTSFCFPDKNKSLYFCVSYNTRSLISTLCIKKTLINAIISKFNELYFQQCNMQHLVSPHLKFNYRVSLETQSLFYSAICNYMHFQNCFWQLICPCS